MEQGVTGYEPKHHLCYCLSNINLNRTIIGSIQKGLYLNCDWLGQHTSQHYAELSTSWLWSRMTLGIGTPEQLCQEAACLHCSLLGRRNGPGSDRQGPLPPLNPFFCLCCQQPAWDPACETWQGQAAVQHAPRSACSQRLCSGGRCDVRAGSFWQKAAHNFWNYGRACWQVSALKMTTVVTLARGLYPILHQLPPHQAGQLPVWKWLFMMSKHRLYGWHHTTVNGNAIGHLMPHSSLALGTATWHGGLWLCSSCLGTLLSPTGTSQQPQEPLETAGKCVAAGITRSNWRGKDKLRAGDYRKYSLDPHQKHQSTQQQPLEKQDKKDSGHHYIARVYSYR